MTRPICENAAEGWTHADHGHVTRPVPLHQAMAEAIIVNPVFARSHPFALRSLKRTQILQQFTLPERLAQKTVHSSGITGCRIALLRIRGQSDDLAGAAAAILFVAPDPARCLKPPMTGMERSMRIRSKSDAT